MWIHDYDVDLLCILLLVITFITTIKLSDMRMSQTLSFPFILGNQHPPALFKRFPPPRDEEFHGAIGLARQNHVLIGLVLAGPSESSDR